VRELWKSIIGLLGIGLIIFGVDHFLSPVSELRLHELIEMPIQKMTLLFEALVVIVVLGGFVVQQFFHHAGQWVKKEHSNQDTAARWQDLLYVFVAIFASAVLYICFFKLASSLKAIS